MPMLNITKVVREHVPLKHVPTSKTSKTIGQMIDEYLSAARDAGTEVQTVAVEFEQVDWHEYCENLPRDPRFDRANPRGWDKVD